VRVAPGRGVEAAQIVAAQEAHAAVYHEHFAVLQGVAARVEYLPRPAEALVGEGLDSRRKLLEGTGNNQVTEAVKDHVDGDPRGGFAR
jgi:hypothetical protein